MVNTHPTADEPAEPPEHPILVRAAPPPTRTVRYGDDDSQVYDVRSPSGPARGVTVLVIHGGFWRARIDRSHAGSQSQAYADDGFHVAVLEYRRAGAPGGGWPGTFDDVRAGLGAIRQDPRLPTPIVAVGHSAGGHLAVWSLSQPEAAGALGAVSLAGCVDLEATAREHLGDGAALDLMGGGPDDRRERYAAADPARLVPAPSAVRLVHGERDTVVPPSISRSYQHASAAAGREVPLTVIPAAGHYELIDPDDAAFAPGLADVRALGGGD